MEFRILTLRYSPKLGAIDDGPLLALGRDHDILELREHFFMTRELPHLLCVVSCRQRPTTAAPATPKPQPPPLPPETNDPPKRSPTLPPPDLSKAERELYDELRRWRAEQAEEAGVPRYVVLTNRDVELLVRRRPDSLAALGRIPGIGKAKLTRYGEALLELLQPPEPEPEPEPEPTDAEIAEAPS